MGYRLVDLNKLFLEHVRTRPRRGGRPQANGEAITDGRAQHTLMSRPNITEPHRDDIASQYGAVVNLRCGSTTFLLQRFRSQIVNNRFSVS
jgi:hypothetical protein